MEMHRNWPLHWIAIVSLVIINHIQAPTKARLYRLYNTQQKTKEAFLSPCVLVSGRLLFSSYYKRRNWGS